MSRHQKRLTRRAFFGGLGALGLSSIWALGKLSAKSRQIQLLDDPTRDFSVNGSASLRERATAKELLYGAFAQNGYQPLHQDELFRLSFIKECSLVVGGFYWFTSRPNPDVFNFEDTDALLEFANTHQMLFRGHPLVWHLAEPQWLIDKFANSNTSKQEIETLLTGHIATIVGKYAGKVHSWDVVNEAIEPKDGRSDSLRKTAWLKFLGPDYIDLAFRTAAAMDPHAKLTYNDYGLEYDSPTHEARRTAVLKLLERLKAKGTPIHAFGMQSHLDGSEIRFNPDKLRRFLADVASLGLEIYITELDVSDKDLPSDINTRDRIVAGAYRDYLSVVLEQPAVKAIVTWGLSDRYSWLSEFAPRSDRLSVRPLPLDENMNRKLAWQAIAQCFDQYGNR